MRDYYLKMVERLKVLEAIFPQLPLIHKQRIEMESRLNVKETNED